MIKAIKIENTIKSIVRETVGKCADKGVNVSDLLAQYLVQLIALDPMCNFISDGKVRKGIAENLVQICVDKLCEKTPSLATLKMQVHFDNHFVPRADLITTNRTKRKQKTSVILKEISEITARTREALKKMYRKIVVAITVYSGLGSPTDISVLQETSDALQSIFPLTELEKFLCLPHKEKEHRTAELAHIVAGIRLFNKECERGGEGIENLPLILRETITYLQENLQKSMHHVMELIHLLTIAVENSIKNVSRYNFKVTKQPHEDENNGNNIETKHRSHNCKTADESKQKLSEEKQTCGKTHDDIETHRKDHVTNVNTGEDSAAEPQQSEEVNEDGGTTEHVLEVAWEDIELIKDSLVAARQHEVYLRKLSNEVNASNSVLKRWHKINIREVIKFKTTEEIYPEFMKMSEAWEGLLDEKKHLENIKFIYWNLHNLMQILETLDQDLLYSLAGDCPILSDDERIEATTEIIIDHSLVQCEVIEPSKVSDFDQIPVQYLGFCAGMLVLGRGALIPGNPNMGLCLWKGLYYTFSSLEQAYAFGTHPDEFVDAAILLARKKPELISLLQLQQQICHEDYTYNIRDRPRGSRAVIKRHNSVQTELHPIPAYIDPDYIWNEWELKRNAIRLVNICRSTTHSTQTYQSHKKSTIGCQTTNKKTVSCQTNIEGSSNVPTLRNFIFGLRGRIDAQQYVITLTRPVNE